MRCRNSVQLLPNIIALLKYVSPSREAIDADAS